MRKYLAFQKPSPGAGKYVMHLAEQYSTGWSIMLYIIFFDINTKVPSTLVPSHYNLLILKTQLSI